MREERFKTQFTDERQDIIRRFKAEINIQSVIDKGLKRLDIPGTRSGTKHLIITMEETAELESAVINYFSMPRSIVEYLDKDDTKYDFQSSDYLNLIEELADVSISLVHIMSAFKLDSFVGSLTARCNPCGWGGNISNELVRKHDSNQQEFVNNSCLLLERFIMECARFIRGKHSDDEFKECVARCWGTLTGIRRVAKISNEDMRVAEDIKWLRLHDRNASGSFL